jgi:hypothetical protein
MHQKLNGMFLENFYKAEFAMSGQYVTAYYDATANLIAVTRNVSSFQLPITLQTKLKTSYESHWISDLFELSDDNEQPIMLRLKMAMKNSR